MLREVRIKMAESEAMLGLVSSLRDLRQHRLNRGAGHGYVTTEAADAVTSQSLGRNSTETGV